MGSSGQARTDGADRSRAPTDAHCRSCAVVQIRAARYHYDSADIGKADIGVEINIQAAYQNPVPD